MDILTDTTKQYMGVKDLENLEAQPDEATLDWMADKLSEFYNEVSSLAYDNGDMSLQDMAKTLSDKYATTNIRPFLRLSAVCSDTLKELQKLLAEITRVTDQYEV